MRCPYTEKLVEFRLSLLEGPEADAVADHLFNDDRCPECEAELRKSDDLVEAVRAYRQQKPG